MKSNGYELSKLMDWDLEFGLKFEMKLMKSENSDLSLVGHAAEWYASSQMLLLKKMQKNIKFQVESIRKKRKRKAIKLSE